MRHGTTPQTLTDWALEEAHSWRHRTEATGRFVRTPVLDLFPTQGS
jgi:hypothetical protein